MARLMSVALTEPQVRARTKTVTRRADPWRGDDRPCYGCGSKRAVSGQNGYCSAECRFLGSVDKDGPISSWRPDLGCCWTWLGKPHNSKGYGRFVAYCKRWLAHRYSHALFVGPIPSGHDVDHLCRNTSCVNPGHLESVTREEHKRRTDYGLHNRSKTHCPQNHEYTPENTRISRGANAGRHCRECESERTSR